MPSTDSWQERPLTLVEHIFNQQNSDGWLKVALNEFRTRIKGLNNVTAIPSLNNSATHELTPNSLVRFRCMIQDSYENEMFLQRYTLLNQKTGQKKDYEVQHDYSALTTRQVYYGVSVPAECEWIKKGWKDVGHTKLNKVQPSNTLSNKRKRDLEDDDMEVSSNDCLPTKEDEENKKAKLSNPDPPPRNEAVYNKNHPLPGESGPVCLLKVYDESEDLKINEIYEFYGILSVDPALSDIYDGEHEEMGIVDSEENKAHNPPASLVPRLHVVASKPLRHINPFVGPDLSQDLGNQLNLLSVRSGLLELLKKATFGDSLAAEYLFLHLISRVYSRHSTLALGKFSLNISGIAPDSDYPRILCKFLRELVTKMHYLSMSLETFNAGRFVPTKNYNTNRLDAGILQLSKGTHLLLDETAMKPGNLDANGVRNIKALKDLIAFQKVAYNFQFSEMTFESDVKLKPEMDVPKDIESYFTSFCSTLPSEVLDKCRSYITAAKFADYKLDDEISKSIQEDFVTERRRDTAVSAEDLHSWLVLARLMSISHGKQGLSKQIWDRVKVVETQRKTRLAQSSQQNGY